MGRTIAVALLGLGSAQLVNPTPNPLLNGSWIVNRATGAKDVAATAATDLPLLGGLGYSVWAAKPVVVYPGGLRVGIPQTSADVLALLRTLPGCSVAGQPFYPAEGRCR